MSIIHDQERAAYKKIMDYFDNEKRYVVLLAPMQSGKSNTFKMVGAEMLRHKLVDRVVIFSGNREKSLFKQTKSHDDFKEAYADFIGSYTRGKSEIKAAVDAVDSFEVVWGPELKRFDPRTASKGENRILYIWEESHYGQSRRQQVDSFLTRVGIQASGDVMPEGCFLLSVSATPFSELSDLYHFNQNKQVVRLIPGSDYISISKMRSNGQIRRVENVQEGMTRILDMLHGRKFVLIRATKAQQVVLKGMIPSSIHVIHHDQSTVVDDSEELEIDPLNSMLANEPDAPTIIFIKGMCRMGKRVDKSNVVAVMETNCDKTKTDTLAQGLLGRMCGYGPHTHIHVYLVKYNEAELDNLAKLHDGDVEAIPNRGANMLGKIKEKEKEKEKEKTSESESDDEKKKYRRTRMMGFPLTCDVTKKDLSMTALLEMDEGTLVDRNTEAHRLKIRPMFRKHLEASIKDAGSRDEEERVLAEHTKVHTKDSVKLREGIENLRRIYTAGGVANKLGSALGVSPSHSEVVFYVDELDGYKFVYMVANMEGTPVAETTGRETFAPKAAKPTKEHVPAPKAVKPTKEHVPAPKAATPTKEPNIPDASFARVGEVMFEQSIMDGRLSSTTRDSSAELEKAILECSAMAKDPKYNGQIKLHSNCSKGMVLHPLVHVALMGGEHVVAKGEIAKRLAEKGIEVHATPKQGRRPAEYTKYMMFAEITITVTMNIAVEVLTSQ